MLGSNIVADRIAYIPRIYQGRRLVTAFLREGKVYLVVLFNVTQTYHLASPETLPGFRGIRTSSVTNTAVMAITKTVRKALL